MFQLTRNVIYHYTGFLFSETFACGKPTRSVVFSLLIPFGCHHHDEDIRDDVQCVFFFYHG